MESVWLAGRRRRRGPVAGASGPSSTRPSASWSSPWTGARRGGPPRSLRGRGRRCSSAWAGGRRAAHACCSPRPRSFCAGVERAIEIVERALDRYGAPVYVRRQIVHNVHVVATSRRAGRVFVDELDEVPDGRRVVFAAHGVAPEVRDEADERDLAVIDATCPLVAKVHAEARRFAGARLPRSC